ncbi:restriction endonuclease [Streptomyces sp. NBC_00582]|uniref:restriction endonuclease n=1 Tax=Streptomyces sp. NBC_00582 TaxID=2975783 RepID=UPI0010645456|nr:restriction endonuclease [Streptomyces sp. NBC_00582]WUB67122.1 restriction endonuclease [Streptomyces sp. NBC_00582]
MLLVFWSQVWPYIVGSAGVGGVGAAGWWLWRTDWDGRTTVIQCKRYAPGNTITCRELRDLLGAKVHFQADVAVFVTTTRFSRPSERFAVEHGILAAHRAPWAAAAGRCAVPRRDRRVEDPSATAGTILRRRGGDAEPAGTDLACEPVRPGLYVRTASSGGNGCLP